MRYVRIEDVPKDMNLTDKPNISVTGSVTGMQQIYGWPKGGQVRIGSYVYNVGTDVVQELRNRGILKGE